MTGGTYALSHLETIALDEGTGEFYDAEELFDYWMDQTEGACNEGLMRKVTSQINDTLSWLEAMGCKMYTTGNTRPDAPAPLRSRAPARRASSPPVPVEWHRASWSRGSRSSAVP